MKRTEKEGRNKAARDKGKEKVTKKFWNKKEIQERRR
jgi:hypothetical protein